MTSSPLRRCLGSQRQYSNAFESVMCEPQSEFKAFSAGFGLRFVWILIRAARILILILVRDALIRTSLLRMHTIPGVMVHVPLGQSRAR